MVHVLILAVALATGGEKSLGQSFIDEGARLPSFELRTTEGRSFESESLLGKAGCLVFLRPGQEQSLAVIRELRRLRERLDGWEAILVFPGKVDGEKVEEMLAEARFPRTAVLDPERRAYSRFGVVALPSVAVFDPRSRVVYSRAGLPKDLGSRLASHLREALGKEPEPKPKLRSRAAAKLELARALVRAEKLEEAEGLLRQTLEEETSLEGHLLLGDVLLGTERPKEALARFELAARGYPSSPRPRIGAARALAALDRSGEARKMLERVTLRFPSSWEAHAALAELHERAGREALAIRHYKKALALLREALEKERDSGST